MMATIRNRRAAKRAADQTYAMYSWRAAATR
jgi:hypothetical protein